MDEKDKFDGTEKIEEEEEKVYIARHADVYKRQH